MKSLQTLTRILLFVAGFFSLANAAEDGTWVAMPAGTIAVPNGIKAADVQQAILLAGTGRGWTVKEKSDDTVVLTLEKGGWRAMLTFVYDTKEIKITSNSGKTDRKGKVAKPAVPESWVNYIKQDINKHMGVKAFTK